MAGGTVTEPDPTRSPAPVDPTPAGVECSVCKHHWPLGVLARSFLPDGKTAVWRCCDFHACAATIHACAKGEHDHEPLHDHHLHALNRREDMKHRPHHERSFALLIERVHEHRREHGISHQHQT
jgi:hypothetical protein